MKKLMILTLVPLAFWGCETVIEPDLADPENALTVDAWINNKNETQKIRIYYSQPYFDNSTPDLILGCTVTVTDLENGLEYTFSEGEDNYFWEPQDGVFGQEGHTYLLEVTVEEETFVSISTMERVPEVDSIVFEFKEADQVVKSDYYLGEFLAQEPEGAGDAYWIKAWKNEVFLGKPSELNMTYDAGFSAGQPVDGEQFILPVRKSLINPEDVHPENAGELLPPYEEGDSLTIEIHSLDQAAFDFLYAVYFQINRGEGFAELFSFPLANVSTNLEPLDENSQTNVLGFFCVSSVSGKGQKLTKEIAEAARGK